MAGLLEFFYNDAFEKARSHHDPSNCSEENELLTYDLILNWSFLTIAKCEGEKLIFNVATFVIFTVW